MNRSRGYLLSMVVVLGVFVLALAGCGRSADTGVVYVVQMAPPTMLSQLASGEIDAYVAWEPFNAEAALEGGHRYLVTSKEIWKDHPCCVLAVSGSVRDERLIKAVLWAHVRATRFLNDPANWERSVAYAMEFTGKGRAIAEEGLRNTTFVEFPDESQFRLYYQRLKEGGLLKRGASDIGYNSEEEFFRDFLDGSYYREIVSRLNADPSWTPEPVSHSTSLRLGYIAQDLHELAVYVAEKEGYYQQVGLVPGANLDIRTYSNGVAVMEGFKVKEIDMSYLGGAPATLKRVNDDIKIRLLAGANNEGSAVVVRKGSGIGEIRDLEGKTVAVPGIGTVQYYLLEQAVKAKGLRLQLK